MERNKMKIENSNRLRMEDIDALKTLLEKIWALGDRDEMSIKHIGHGLAALVTWQDWTAALDYDLPDMDMTEKKLEKLAEYWQQVKELLHGVSAESYLNAFRLLPIAVYGAVYLDRHSDYYKESATI
jgi:hypothetical protein